MTSKEAQQIMDIVESFCIDNEGKKINQWLRTSLVGPVKTLLNQILERQEKENIQKQENKKEIITKEVKDKK